MHLAVISGNTRVVRKLLIKGSDKTMRDKQGKTPADLAKENGFHNILKMLVKLKFISFLFRRKKLLGAKTWMCRKMQYCPCFQANEKKEEIFNYFLLFICTSEYSYNIVHFFMYRIISKHNF